MSSNGSHLTSTSSTIPPSPIASSALSKIEPNDDYVYPQGLSLKESQANSHTNASPSQVSKIIDPKLPCASMPIMPIPNDYPSACQEPHTQIKTPTLSLKVASCQEKNPQCEKTNISYDQDQDTIHPSLAVDQSRICDESHDDSIQSPPTYDEG